MIFTAIIFPAIMLGMAIIAVLYDSRRVWLVILILLNLVYLLHAAPPKTADTCTVPVPLGSHEVQVIALYQHRAIVEGPLLPRPYTSEKSLAVFGPGEITVGGEGHPCGFKVYVDDVLTLCGEQPEGIFFGDFETGSLSAWTWETNRLTSVPEEQQ